MDATRHFRKPNRLFISLLVLTSFLTMGSDSAVPSRPKPSDTFSITISQPKSPVCIGESRLLTIRWNPANKNDILAPLSGPRVMYAKALYGSLDRSTYHPGPLQSPSQDRPPAS